MKNKLPLTSTQKQLYGLPKNTTLKLHYKNADMLLEDYHQYIMKFQDRKEKPSSQYILDIKQVWMSVDKSFCLFPNAVKYYESIESSFYLPQKKRLLENKDKDVEEQQVHIEAKTISSKLGSVVRFLKYLEERSIFAGFSRQELNSCKEFLRELKTGLRNLITERVTKMKEFKSNIFMTPEIFKNYGSSDHISELHTFLSHIKHSAEKTKVTQQMAVHVRNYIIIKLSYTNALRASNLINMTLKDFNAAKPDKEITETFVFRSDNYKVSLIYGAKIVLASQKLFQHIKLYMKYLRPLLKDDKHRLDRERYFFVASRSDAGDKKVVQLKHSTLTPCMTRSLERTGLFEGKKEIYKRVSCSRIRFSVITELCALGEDSLDNIAYCFGKHSKEVCKKFYVQFFSTREAARLSWKCHQMYNSEEEKKEVDCREINLKDQSYPVEKVEKWIIKRMDILKLSGTEVDDSGLMNIINRFRDELQFHKLNG